MYIAIKENKHEMINNESDLNKLINDGFTLYTKEEYQQFILEMSTKSVDETIEYLEIKAQEYISFGNELWLNVKRKIWALNTYNKSIGVILSKEKMMELISTTESIEKTLKASAFNESIIFAEKFKQVFPQYSNISDLIVNELEIFMSK